MKKIIFFFLFLVVFSVTAIAQRNADAVIGRWRSNENNFEIEIFKTGNQFKAKVVWLDDSNNKSKPMYVRNDIKNPNVVLRSRKIIGMEVMYGLIYNAIDNVWEKGRIYDASKGKEWNAKASLSKDGILKIRGFWHLECLGQNIYLRRVL